MRVFYDCAPLRALNQSLRTGPVVNYLRPRRAAGFLAAEARVAGLAAADLACLAKP